MSETLERGVVAVVTENPVAVLTDAVKFDAFYEAIAQEAKALKPDLTTEKGRKAIAAMAYKVTRTKTAIDDAGKKLNEDARKRINVVDAARRDIRERLDALAAEVRAPLTKWEVAEAERLAWCNSTIAHIKSQAAVGIEATSETVAATIVDISAIEIEEGRFRELFGLAEMTKSETIVTLANAHSRLLREEADRAELARLRAEAEARAEADRIAREEADAKAEAERKEAARIEAARLDAEIAEQARKDAEAREQRRIEEARQEAANAAQREAERVAREAQAERDRAHEEELAAARKEAERLAKIERDRIAAEQQAEAARKAQEAEDARRAADRKHRGEIMKAAKEAIVASGCVSADQAKSIVLAIVAGEIPNVSMRF